MIKYINSYEEFGVFQTIYDYLLCNYIAFFNLKVAVKGNEYNKRGCFLLWHNLTRVPLARDNS